jgi:Mg2+/Co2+ transporter CorB
VRLVAVLAPFATVVGGSVTIDTLANCIIRLLEVPLSNFATQCAAAEGLQPIVNSMSPQLQASGMKTVLKIFQLNVKQTTIARIVQEVKTRGPTWHN